MKTAEKDLNDWPNSNTNQKNLDSPWNTDKRLIQFEEKLTQGLVDHFNRMATDEEYRQEVDKHLF
jgi:hypothetical protein